MEWLGTCTLWSDRNLVGDEQPAQSKIDEAKSGPEMEVVSKLFWGDVNFQ